MNRETFWKVALFVFEDISSLLKTEEGREAIARAMVEPIKKSIVEYPPYGNPAYYP